MWDRLNVEWARLMTKNIPAIRDGRGVDILRHELGWYPRAHLREKRKTVNKYAQRYLGFKPFKIGKSKRFKKGGGMNKRGEEALRKLIMEMQSKQEELSLQKTKPLCNYILVPVCILKKNSPLPAEIPILKP